MAKKQTQFIPVGEDEEGLSLSKRILRRLMNIGKMNSTYDDVIEDLLNHCDSCDQFWENKT